MKKTVLKTVSATAVVFVAVLLTLSVNSCKKSDNGGNAANFAGSYAGTDSAATSGQSLGTQSDTVKIVQASGSSTLTITSTQGAFTPITASASGNNITIASQANTFINAPTNVSGNGSLSGSTLKLNLNFATSGVAVGTGNFVGTKQ